MPISVIDPVNPAIRRARWILFEPFDIGKWFTLGFCAWLAQLANGGGAGFNGGGGPGGGGPGGGGGPEFEPVVDWIQQNLALILIITVVVFVVGLLVSLLVIWLSSRGQFMFLDGVVRNRGAVREPWSEYEWEGNSLFLFRVCLGLATFGLIALVAATAVAIAWPDLQSRQFGGSAAAAVGLSVLLMLPIAITASCVSLFLRDFVVPIMYVRRIRVMPAWHEFHQFMLANHAGTFVLYVLFKIVLTIGIGIIALLAVCLTCCIAALPYIGTVVLLPLSVFHRAYSLYFIEQFGPEWKIIVDDDTVPGTEYEQPLG